MRTTAATLVLFAAGLAGQAALADEHAEMERPSFRASQTYTLEAIVEAIDHETREVTLALPEGGSVTFEVGEDARNLGQVEVGDTVNAQYTEELSIEVIADDGSAPVADRAGGMARTAEGRKPGVAVMETDVVTAKVMEINLEDETFRLGYPDGRVEQYQARNPENLRRAEVGDLVVFTATTSFSLVVD